MATRLSLSAIVPTRDTREVTLTGLERLFRADLPPGEVIVVDDGSRDGTLEAVRDRYPEARLLHHEAPQGFTVAANRGLHAARGEILWLLNSDTEVSPEAPGELLRAFQGDARLGVAGATLLNRDGSPQWSGGPRPGPLWCLALASGLGRLTSRLRRKRARANGVPNSVAWVSGAALAMRRSVWEQCGPLDERFTLYCQDLDVCMRTGAAGWEIRLLPGCRVVHRQGLTVERVAGERQDLALLWSDLVRWGMKQGGPPRGRQMARALYAGGRLRRAALRLRLPFTRGAQRVSVRHRLRAIEHAAAALHKVTPKHD